MCACMMHRESLPKTHTPLYLMSHAITSNLDAAVCEPYIRNDAPHSWSEVENEDCNTAGNKLSASSEPENVAEFRGSFYKLCEWSTSVSFIFPSLSTESQPRDSQFCS
jgi:hypothetical protein